MIIPPSRPAASASRVLKAALAGIDSGVVPEVLLSRCPVMVLAVRGYYSQTFAPDGNNVAVFDDAAFLIDLGKNELIRAFNWNTDPSRLGYNAAIGKPFAILQPGLWMFRRGQHKGNGPAWRQITSEEAPSYRLPDFFASEDPRAKGEFRVWRGQVGGEEETDYQAINIHWGGKNSTSSWGCQTASPAQWPQFLSLSYARAARLLPYILIDNSDFPPA